VEKEVVVVGESSEQTKRARAWDDGRLNWKFRPKHYSESQASEQYGRN
jgi:hypothetical protein